MAIKEKIDEIAILLQRVKKYSDLIDADNFTEDTVLDMKQNAKDVCDDAKGDIDEIKSEIDTWE